MGLLISLWFTFCLFVTFFIYFWIFKGFTWIGGRKKAKKLLRSPKKYLEDFVNTFTMNYAWKVFKAVEGDDKGEKNLSLSVETKWVDIFIQLCHWTGYQVIIRKDSEKDIESLESEALDITQLENVGNIFAAYNEKTKSLYHAIKKDEEDLKKGFEL